MRINRLGTYRRRRRYRSTFSWMLYIILPVMAMAVALFMSDTLKNTSINVMRGLDNNQTVVDTFNQVFNLEGKEFYRVELGSFEDKPLADKFVSSLKTGKLNAFIINEDRFKVIYGIFSTSVNAVEVSTMLDEKKKENVINAVRLSGVSLKYGNEDKAFVEVVKSADELMDKILGSKSQLSKEYAQQSYVDYEAKLCAIITDEERIAKYLEDVKQAKVSENLRIFREQYIKLLMDFEKSSTVNFIDLEKKGTKLESEKKDYYKLQNSMLLQVKSYKDFLDRLSI